MDIKKHVVEIIEKEKKLISLLKENNISLTDGPLDFSFSPYIIALLRLPDEKEISTYTHEVKNYDKFYNEYTEMIFEDLDIEKTVNSWFVLSEKIKQNVSLKKIAKKYEKEQKEIKKTLKALKLENSIFENFIDDKLLEYFNP